LGEGNFRNLRRNVRGGFIRSTQQDGVLLSIDRRGFAEGSRDSCAVSVVVAG
jgi:hypothetical protein